MSLTDLFKAKQYKTDLEAANARIAELEAQLTPEMREAEAVQAKLAGLQSEYDVLMQKHDELRDTITRQQSAIDTLEGEIESRNSKILSLNDKLLIQDFGLYEPYFDFTRADEYKARISEIRAEQADMIKHKTAVTGNTEWTVNDSAAKGRKMVSDMQKLLLRAFNSECDELVSRVKYSNYEACLKRMSASRDAISKLGEIMRVSITEKYYQLKVSELRLALEYQLKKQQEKEEQKEARAQAREAEKLQREIEAQRKKTQKEEAHFTRALAEINRQIAVASPEALSDLEEKKREIEDHLRETLDTLQSLDYREANQRAGYVYIISNIGAFGEGVYKIGMTRRLDPQERVDELSDASVPFNFDIHAMIFSNDAPALEAALHRAFADRKLNMVNQRREFFRVTLDEIKEVVRANFDKTVEFIDVPDAEQYRISEKMREET